MSNEPQQPAADFPRRKIPRWPFWVLAAVLVLSGAAIAIGYQYLYTPAMLTGDEIVRIRRGSTMGHVARSLQQRRMIHNAFAFHVYARLTHKADKLKVGDYQVKPGMRPVDILDLLISGKGRLLSLTVPPGRWLSEVPPIVAQRWPQAADEFMQLASDMPRWRSTVSFPLEGKTLEGYLYPDTYLFGESASAELIITRMLQRFEEVCYAEYQRNPPGDNRSLSEVLILASLVEAEARQPDERPIIAGVYMNRLHATSPNPRTLDCDATLLYAMQERHPRVLYRHKLVDSPYNTYHHIGLPPGPINNPELQSFRAALHPAETPYFYYVAREDGSGYHLFGRTLAEQSANIRRVRGR